MRGRPGADGVPGEKGPVGEPGISIPGERGVYHLYIILLKQQFTGQFMPKLTTKKMLRF